MKQTPPRPPSLRATRHPHASTRAQARPASQLSVSGAGPALHKQPGAVRSRERAARSLPCPLRAARCPLPGRSARQLARAQATQHVRLGLRRRGRCSDSRGRRRGREPRRGPDPSASSFCGSGGSCGAPPEPPESSSRAHPRGRGATEREERATAPALPDFCPARDPAFVLVAPSRIGPHPCRHPVPVAASAQPSRLGPEGLRAEVYASGPRDGGLERGGLAGTGRNPEEVWKALGSVSPTVGQGASFAVTQDKMGRGCLRGEGARVGRMRGA